MVADALQLLLFRQKPNTGGRHFLQILAGYRSPCPTDEHAGAQSSNGFARVCCRAASGGDVADDTRPEDKQNVRFFRNEAGRSNGVRCATTSVRLYFKHRLVLESQSRSASALSDTENSGTYCLL